MNLFQKWARRLLGNRRPFPAPQDLFALCNSAWIGQAAYAALAHGAIDAIDEEPRNAADLAVAIGGDAVRLEQILRALAAFGILFRDASGRYEINETSRVLTADANTWLRHYLLLWGEQLYAAAGAMQPMLNAPTTGFTLAHGADLYEHYRRDAAASERFAEFMNLTTSWQREEIVRRFDFGEYSRIIDVGGGKGGLLGAVLKACPRSAGVVIDQPHMGDFICRQMASLGVADRFEFAGGSFFDPLPATGDLFMIKHVLHDWADDDATRILQRIADAMSEASRLLIIEGIVDHRGDNAHLLACRDLEQMVWTGGRLRTRDELERLLADCGLRAIDIASTTVPDADLLLCQPA